MAKFACKPCRKILTQEATLILHDLCDGLTHCWDNKKRVSKPLIMSKLQVKCTMATYIRYNVSATTNVGKYDTVELPPYNVCNDKWARTIPEQKFTVIFAITPQVVHINCLESTYYGLSL